MAAAPVHEAWIAYAKACIEAAKVFSAALNAAEPLWIIDDDPNEPDSNSIFWTAIRTAKATYRAAQQEAYATHLGSITADVYQNIFRQVCPTLRNMLRDDQTSSIILGTLEGMQSWIDCVAKLIKQSDQQPA